LTHSYVLTGFSQAVSRVTSNVLNKDIQTRLITFETNQSCDNFVSDVYMFVIGMYDES